MAKTTADEHRRCAVPLPGFGFTGARIANSAAVLENLNLLHDLFGTDLTAAVARDRTAARCQREVWKAVIGCDRARLRDFTLCKRDGLADGSIADGSALGRCLERESKPIRAACDPVAGGVRKAIARQCGAPGVASLAITLPGCATDDPAALSACLGTHARCRACRAVRLADALARDCDTYDDGLANESCR